MSSIATDQTINMINHVMEVWNNNKAIIILPKTTDKSHLLSDIDNVEREDIQVIKHNFHPDRIRPVSQEWEIIVHDLIKLGVVFNQHGFYTEQLKYK